MADEYHLKLLRKGVERWNDWCSQHEDIPADLASADLANTDLSHAHLFRADLGGANLRGADLSHATLVLANLNNADLRSANLAGADLRANLRGARLNIADLNSANLHNVTLDSAHLNYANLGDAYMYSASLKGADLSHARLVRTTLDYVELHGAQMQGTVLDEIDLRSATGLAEIVHRGPSPIVLHSVQLPEDGSALHFLRGCGVPDEWIDFWRSTMMNPIQYRSCFISYAHQNDDFAYRIHSDLQNHGVRCWFAPHDMKIGDKIRSRIDEAIHLQDKLLLILSEDSVASEWVEHEVERALAREHREKRTILFPIRLDNTILEHEYTGWAALVQNERHIGDFTGWKDHDQYQVAFKRLLRDLK